MPDTVLANLVLRDEGAPAAGSVYRHWSLNLVVHGAFYRIGRLVVAMDAQEAAEQLAAQLTRG